ncbi:MAG: type II secretion system F family protein [Lentihominibacter sp.]
MIRDYSKYEMNEREKFLFYAAGYAAIALVLFLFYHRLAVSAAGGFLVLRLRPFYENYRASARMEALRNQFKDLLYSLSASVSSGRHMGEALIEAADNLGVLYRDDEPIMQELHHMKRSMLENNESDSILLTDFAERSKCEDIDNFVQVYITCRAMGGNLPEIITRTSDILTDKMNIQREIQAITAQKKLEGRLIALMPAGMLLALNLLSPSYIAPLYGNLPGMLIMTGCLCLTVWGVYLMEKISSVEI